MAFPLSPTTTPLTHSTARRTWLYLNCIDPNGIPVEVAVHLLEKSQELGRYLSKVDRGSTRDNNVLCVYVVLVQVKKKFGRTGDKQYTEGVYINNSIRSTPGCSEAERPELRPTGLSSVDPLGECHSWLVAVERPCRCTR